MVQLNMDLSQAETFLSSQTKKQVHGISDSQAKAFQKAWKNNRQKIHDTLVGRCMWNDTLRNVSWRIDVKTKTMNTDQVHVPVVNMLMDVGNDTDEKVLIAYTYNCYSQS